MVDTICECGGTFRPFYGVWKCKWCGKTNKDSGTNHVPIKLFEIEE